MFKNLFKKNKIQLLTEISVEKALKQNKITEDEVNELLTFIPNNTPPKRKDVYITWLVTQYIKDKENGTIWDDNLEDDLKNTLLSYEHFLRIPQQNIIPSDKKDISNFLNTKDFIDFGKTFLQDKYEQYIKKQIKKQEIQEGATLCYTQYKCNICNDIIYDEKKLLSHSCWEKSFPQTTITKEFLISKGAIKPIIEVIELTNISAVEQYCSQTTWCITDKQIFENYYKNLGCKFYLVVNHSFAPSSPCNKSIVVVFPPEHKRIQMSIGNTLATQLRAQKYELIEADPEFKEYFEKFEKYMNMFSSFIGTSDQTAYAVFTSNDKIMSFTTFINLFKIPREVFVIPPNKPVNFSSAAAADAAYANESKLLVKAYSIDENNKIHKEEQKQERGYSEEIAEILDNWSIEDPENPGQTKNLNMGYLITEVAETKDKLLYVINDDSLDTNKYCDVKDLEIYKKFDFKLLGGFLEDEDFKVYMAINPPRAHHNYFFLLPRNDENTFYFLRYIQGEDYRLNQLKEVFGYIEAVYVDKEVDDKLAYYCKQQQDKQI
jgi:hypothetical protein